MMHRKGYAVLEEYSKQFFNILRDKNIKEIKRDYKDYIKEYICTDVKNVLGVEKIKKTIKQIYRLD